MNNKLSLQDLASILSEQTGKTEQDCERFLREFISVITEGVLVDKIVKVKGLGTFKIIQVEERASVSVNTGERVVIPAHNKFTFIPDKSLKELVNKPFSLFETVELDEEIEISDVETPVEEEVEEIQSDSSDVKEEAQEEKIPQISAEENQEDSVSEKIEESPSTDEIPSTEKENVEEVQTESDSVEEESKEEKEIVTEVFTTTEENVVEDSVSETSAETSSSSENKQEEKTETSVVPVNKEVHTEVPVKHHSSHHRRSHHKSSFLHRVKRKVFGTDSTAFLLVCLLAIVILGITYIVFLSDRYTLNKLLDSDLMEAPAVSKNENATPVPAVEEKDSVTLNATKSEEASAAETKEEVKEQPQKETEVKQVTTTESNASSDVLAEVSIKAGDRLTTLAKHYYGHKLFWVYIYQYNKDRIANPNNVPIGTKIRIPAAHIYGIDAKDKNSLDKAASLQSQIMQTKY